MVARVRDRRSTYNNQDAIAKSKLRSAAKVLYYRAMAALYGLAGGCADVAMANSSWTQAHIRCLWGERRRPIRLVYPPCNTDSLQALPLERRGTEPFIVSVAQFRPEKAHDLQVRAFARCCSIRSSDARQEDGVGLDDAPQSVYRRPRLKLVGSCRHRQDEERLAGLLGLAEELGVADLIDFCINVSYEELKGLLGGAVAGLHTMTDEHFGISIVEYMAAGAIPIAHNSAGPKQDIVLEEDGLPTGFLATTEEEFASAMSSVLAMPETDRLQMAARARARAARFSEANFESSFLAAMRPLLDRLACDGASHPE
eukprot:SM000082S22810  [mRNA]  locus=s82:71980:74285:- [translate_table: standard]